MDKIQRTIEIERVVNLVKGFGWELVSMSEDENTLELRIRKTVMPPMPVG